MDDIRFEEGPAKLARRAKAVDATGEIAPIVPNWRKPGAHAGVS